MLNARQLSTNEKLTKVIHLLHELDEKGYIENGYIVFEEEEESKVNAILKEICPEIK